MESSIPDDLPRLIPAEYEAPRELEHPLHSIREISAGTLVWIQPQLMRPAYELWAGERVLATLRFRGLFHNQALGASAEGLWTFERTDLNGSEIKVTQRGRVYATFKMGEEDLSLLALNNGASFVCKGTGSRWSFLNVLGQPVIHLVPECSPQVRLRVELPDGVARTPVVSFLALLGNYVLLGRRSASTA